HLHREVERHGGVRECADADVIDTGLRDCADTVEGHVARRLETWRPFRGAGALHGPTHLVERHVVEHDTLCPCVDGLFQLIEIAHFDLDRYTAAILRGHHLERGRDATRHRDVVLLEEHHVMEAVTMIRTTAGPHGGL